MTAEACSNKQSSGRGSLGESVLRVDRSSCCPGSGSRSRWSTDLSGHPGITALPDPRASRRTRWPLYTGETIQQEAVAVLCAGSACWLRLLYGSDWYVVCRDRTDLEVRNPAAVLALPVSFDLCHSERVRDKSLREEFLPVPATPNHSPPLLVSRDLRHHPATFTWYDIVFSGLNKNQVIFCKLLFFNHFR